MNQRNKLSVICPSLHKILLACFFLASIFIIPLVTSPALSPTSLALAATDDNRNTKDDSWKTYAPEEDINAIQGQAKQLAALAARSDPNATPMERLTKLRLGFAFATKARPIPEGIKVTSYDMDGVKGLWIDGPDSAASSSDHENEKVLLIFHGGGYSFGNPESNVALAANIILYPKMRAFAPYYRLAPENPYPAALEDAVAAYKMLLKHGVQAHNIVLCGESAGGGLALATLLKLRDTGIPLPAGAYLISPWTDLTNSSESHNTQGSKDKLIFTKGTNNSATMYAGKEDLKNPYISPLFADLTGLPPLLIHVGSHEILLDDSMMLARKAALADVPVEVKVWPGYPHTFPHFLQRFKASHKAVQEAAAFVQDALAGRVLY